MDFLGVGPMELLLVLIIALIVLGPKDMVKAGRSLGVFLRNIIKSPLWHSVQQTSRDLRYLPNRLIREAGLEEEAEELKKIGLQVDELNKSRPAIAAEIEGASREINRDLSAWTTPPPTIASPPAPELEPPAAPAAAETSAAPPEAAPPAEPRSEDPDSKETGSEEPRSDEPPSH